MLSIVRKMNYLTSIFNEFLLKQKDPNVSIGDIFG